MTGMLTLHDIATIQIAEPEKVKKGAESSYEVQEIKIIDSAGNIFTVKCFMGARFFDEDGQ